VTLKAGDGATQLTLGLGWQHITALLIPEKAGAYTVKLSANSKLDLRYCEITPFK
jgi:hypothetical protein